MIKTEKTFCPHTKTCPLDQFSLLITNMISDFAGDQYFYMISSSKTMVLPYILFKIVWGYK